MGVCVCHFKVIIIQSIFDYIVLSFHFFFERELNWINCLFNQQKCLQNMYGLPSKDILLHDTKDAATNKVLQHNSNTE